MTGAAAGALALGLLAGAPLAAQELDCSRAVTQVEMNDCAYLDWEAADAELNDAYEAALILAQEADTDFPNGAEEALRDAQRAWLPWRDAACEAEAALWGGGSAEPLIRYGCLATITRQRSEELWAYAGG